MRSSSLAGQIIAVLSRRTPAFQPRPGEPTSVPGRIRALVTAHASPSRLNNPERATRNQVLTQPSAPSIKPLQPGAQKIFDAPINGHQVSEKPQPTTGRATSPRSTDIGQITIGAPHVARASQRRPLRAATAAMLFAGAVAIGGVISLNLWQHSQTRPISPPTSGQHPRPSTTSPFTAQGSGLRLTYTCAFSLIGDQSISVDFFTNIPNSIAMGHSTANYAVKALATMPLEVTTALSLEGASTMAGTMDGQASIEAPQGDLAETVPFEIQKITLPNSSSFTATATGNVPAVTYSKPGRAEIIIDGLTMHLVPRDSSGNLSALGDMNVPCTLNTGQNNVVVSFTITDTTS